MHAVMKTYYARTVIRSSRRGTVMCIVLSVSRSVRCMQYRPGGMCGMCGASAWYIALVCVCLCTRFFTFFDETVTAKRAGISAVEYEKCTKKPGTRITRPPAFSARTS